MGSIKVNDGTILAPGFAFSADEDTGFYRIGSGNVGLSLNTVKVWDYATTATTYSAANSTNNTAFTVENTSNAAAASHAYIDVKVGGTTSTGDAHYRITTPGGTSYYFGSDNSAAGDPLMIGVGTAVGTTRILRIDSTTSGDANGPAALQIQRFDYTASDSANADAKAIYVDSFTTTFAGTTTVTNLNKMVDFTGVLFLGQSGGAMTVNKATQFATLAPVPTTSVTLTEGSAIRVIDTSAASGTYTRQAGIVIEALTRAVTNPQILLYNGSTEHTAAVADSCSISCIDLSAGNASFSFTTETAVVTESVTSDRTWSVRINGTAYKICLKV